MATQREMYNQTACGINYFLSKFKHGVAKRNRFRVEFYLPKGLQSGLGVGGLNTNSLSGNIQAKDRELNANQAINVMCYSVNLPDRTLDTTSYQNLYLPQKLPYFATSGEVNLIFYSDSRYNTREYFDIWINTVFNIHSKTVNYYDEYVSDVNIYGLDAYGNDAYRVTLHEAYPIALGNLDLSYADSELQSVSVTLSYKHWTSSHNKDFTQKTLTKILQDTLNSAPQ